MIFTATYVLYQVISLPVNFAGRGFDLAAHQARIEPWHPPAYPSVDIYLPICGEPIEMLRNTWAAVSGADRGLPRHRAGLCPRRRAVGRGPGPGRALGFGYLRRPVRARTRRAATCATPSPAPPASSSLILDADFAPRPDFLAETLPYMDDPAVAIVQTPQFFRGSPGQSWIENAAGAIQEVFYRSIQVARDRFGAAICVGTSAVYRRAALEPQGGPTLIPYAEDVHTGLDVRRAGWSMRYLPVVLSTGICPDNLDAFVRQQYRWCTGNAGVVFSRRLWSVPMSLPARLTYISGFFYYAYTAPAGLLRPAAPGHHARLPARPGAGCGTSSSCSRPW